MKCASLLFLLLLAELAGVVGGVDVVGVGVLVGFDPLQVDVVRDCHMVALPLERLQLLTLRLRLQPAPALLLAPLALLPVLLQQRLLHARADRRLGDQGDVLGWRKPLPLAHRPRTAQILLETQRVAARLLARLSLLLLSRLLVLPCAVFCSRSPGIRSLFVGGVGGGVGVGGSAVGSPGGRVAVPEGLEGAGVLLRGFLVRVLVGIIPKFWVSGGVLLLMERRNLRKSFAIWLA